MTKLTLTIITQLTTTTKLCKRWKLQHVTNELNNEIWPRTYRKGVLKCNILPGSYPLRGSWQGDEVIEDNS